MNIILLGTKLILTFFAVCGFQVKLYSYKLDFSSPIIMPGFGKSIVMCNNWHHIVPLFYVTYSTWCVCVTYAASYVRMYFKNLVILLTWVGIVYFL